MGESTVKLEGCSSFESNPFKKELCKHCMRPWSEHLECCVFALLFLQSYGQQLEESTAKAKGEETRAKDKAKQPVHSHEYDWLYDGLVPEEDSDEDGAEFKMYTPRTMKSAPIDLMKPHFDQFNKEIKVVNLIEFRECDLPFEKNSPALPWSLPLTHGAPSPLLPGSADLGVIDIEFPLSSTSFRAVSAGSIAIRDEPNEGEVNLLRQMLSDAAEQRRIEVAIVLDEVASKQTIIDDLEAQNATLRARLADVEDQLRQKTAEADECIAVARQACVELDEESDAKTVQSVELRNGLDDLCEELDKEMHVRTSPQGFDAEKQKVDGPQAHVDTLRAIEEQPRRLHRMQGERRPAQVLPNRTLDKALVKKLRRIRRGVETHLAWYLKCDAPKFELDNDRMEPKRNFS